MADGAGAGLVVTDASVLGGVEAGTMMVVFSMVVEVEGALSPHPEIASPPASIEPRTIAWSSWFVFI